MKIIIFLFFLISLICLAGCNYKYFNFKQSNTTVETKCTPEEINANRLIGYNTAIEDALKILGRDGRIQVVNGSEIVVLVKEK